MDFHRLRVDVGLECGEVVGKPWKGESHGVVLLGVSAAEVAMLVGHVSRVSMTTGPAAARWFALRAFSALRMAGRIEMKTTTTITMWMFFSMLGMYVPRKKPVPIMLQIQAKAPRTL